MAEGILFQTVSSLLEVLGLQVFQDLKFPCGFKVEIRKLKDTMETIQAVILDAEEKHSQNNHQIKIWLRRLKAAVYDADDLLDNFATELKRRELMTGNKMVKEVRVFFSKSNKLAYNLKMTHKIKTIRERLDAVKNDRHFHLDENPAKNIEREQTYSFVRAEEVIGREHDKNAIMQLLLESNDVESVSVIAIVGIAGLGKTALAQLVYNDEKVKNHFQLRMWVCISDDFNVETIVKSIIKSANDKYIETLEKLDADQVQERLQKEICGKKYLLILDDVWNENREKWLELKNLLMNDMRGSKILVTTRSQRVAKLTGTLPSHVLKGLNEEDSWSLFTKMAFEREIAAKATSLVQIGKRIVAKCVGVPLAIRTIARLLYYNNTETYWSRFMEDELLKVDQEESDIFPKLKLSYNHLPSHLKQCFAFCALFPKDYEIHKFNLIYLWMAQGFLQPSSPNQRLEDVGNEYFMNLLSRSFFQDIGYNELGNIVTCKMHDLFHDLATLVAGNECIFGKLDEINVDKTTRHISFNSKFDSTSEIPATLLRANHIRTFLLQVPLQADSDLNKSSCNKIFKNFRYLRSLGLKSSNINKLPNSIGKLKHLRYLNLTGNRDIKELPSSMSLLQNLLILKLNKCRSLEKLPGDIEKMVSLRCLLINGCSSLIGMPHGVGLLTNLQALSMFVLSRKEPKTAGLDKLEELNSLRGSLRISGLENATAIPTLANLKVKQYLQILQLSWAINDGSVSIHDEAVLEALQPHQNLEGFSMYRFGGLRICSWLSSLTNLISIHLSQCKQCLYIPPLDQLPSLERMFLHGLHALEYVSEKRSNDSSYAMSTSFFPSLKILEIFSCHNLKGWRRRDDDNDDEATTQTTQLPSFPCLSKLDVRSCPKFTSMPLFASLEELRLRDTSLKPLQQTMMSMNSVPPSTNSAPLSKLQYLEIRNCDKFYLLANLPDNHWELFTSLRSINIFCIPDLVYLPKGLQQVTSLHHLCIKNCPILMVLPRGMRLQVLKIHICPQLSQRYKDKVGVDWAKIAHIPNIRIDAWWVQNEGFLITN